ncbi:DMT family transporter [Flexivirga oryzae]|nr:DMT family transporter [Flexivirga oryzae]
MGALLALASSVVWGSADFGGGLFSKRLAPVRVVAASQVGSLLVMSVVFAGQLLTSGGPHGVTWLWGMGSGVANAAALTCLYAGLSVGTMGVVSPIASLGAVVPVVIGLLTGDTLTTVVGVGLLLAMGGAVLAAGPEFSGSVSRLPVVLAMCAALGFGMSLYCLHRAADGGVVASLWAMRLVSVTELLLVWRLVPRLAAGASPGRRDLPGLFLVGCGDLAAAGLFGLASQHAEVSLASVLASLYPVATLLLARFVLHERMRPVQGAGVAIALLGVVLVVS